MTAASRTCLVYGYSGAEQAVEGTTYAGTDGLCQRHGYDPDQHPSERLAARRDNPDETK